MTKCVTTHQPVEKCICMECTDRRIVKRMHDNGYEAGMAEIEARAPEMEKELREHHERSAGRAAGGDGVRDAR